MIGVCELHVDDPNWYYTATRFCPECGEKIGHWVGGEQSTEFICTGCNLSWRENHARWDLTLGEVIPHG